MNNNLPDTTKNGKLINTDSNNNHEENYSEDIKKWEQFWPELQKAALTSEANYDKKVFAVSVGSIGMELSILQLVQGRPKALWWAISATALCILALLINLIVHYIGKSKQDEQASLLKEFLANPNNDGSSIYDRIVEDNKSLRTINLVSIVLLVLGIICLSVFTFLNLA